MITVRRPGYHSERAFLTNEAVITSAATGRFGDKLQFSQTIAKWRLKPFKANWEQLIKKPFCISLLILTYFLHLVKIWFIPLEKSNSFTGYFLVYQHALTLPKLLSSSRIITFITLTSCTITSQFYKLTYFVVLRGMRLTGERWNIFLFSIDST